MKQCAGTHAIATAFRAALRPNDELLAISGEPYDTLEEVIGTRSSGEGSAGAASSLADWGVSFRVHPLGPDGLIDLAGLRRAVVPGAHAIGRFSAPVAGLWAHCASLQRVDVRR